MVIPERFNGPPSSGHGGYSSGTFAALLPGPGPVAVALRAPPPLQTELDVVREDLGVSVLAGPALVATVTPGEFTIQPPAPVSIQVAERAQYDAADLGEHPFPSCFGCGPDREPGDGLRLFAGPLTAEGAVFACTWAPAAGLADADGRVRDVFVWSALDCPSGAPTGAGASGEAVVLARYVVQIEAAVLAGQPHVLVSRLDGQEGRKSMTSVALYDAEGHRLARGEALWITLSRN